MKRGTYDKKTHVYRIDGVVVPSNTQILTEVGIVDTQWYTEEGKIRGHNVHLACQMLDEDDLNFDALDSELLPYVKAYQKFKAESGFKPDLIEVPCFNHTFHYATTLDRTGTFPSGEYTLLELKSGAVEPWAALQLAGQNECLEKRISRHVLQLKSDGTYRLTKFTDPNDRNVFLSAVSVVHWKRNNGARYAK